MNNKSKEKQIKVTPLSKDKLVDLKQTSTKSTNAKRISFTKEVTAFNNLKSTKLKDNIKLKK
jgi:hypothetical protein